MKQRTKPLTTVASVQSMTERTARAEEADITVGGKGMREAQSRATRTSRKWISKRERKTH